MTQLNTPWLDRSLEPRERGNTCRACSSPPGERCTITESDARRGSAEGYPVGGIRHGAHYFRGWE